MTPDQRLVRYYEDALRRILGLRAQCWTDEQCANEAIEIAREALAARCAHCGQPVENPDAHVCDVSESE
jgi:hypothetical protein